MSVLLLRLAGPLQSWGDSSRFATRGTRREPTKSGVIGMVAAALGRSRDDSMEDLVALRFGTRVDQPGTVVRDFHTVLTGTGKAANSALTERFYVADAVFVVGLEGDSALLDEVRNALNDPTFIIGLGRRSCPPTGQLVLGVVEQPLYDALVNVPWQASDWYQRRQPREVLLEILKESEPGEHGTTQRDVPISFSRSHRQYGWRQVVSHHIQIANPNGHDRDDWFAALEGA